MGKGEGFNFDDFDLGELGNESELEFGDSLFDNDVGLGENINNNMYNSDNTINNISIEDKTSIIKTAIISIVVGLVVILLVFMVMRVFKGSKAENVNIDSNNNIQTENMVNTQPIVVNNQSDWQEVNVDSEIVFNDEYVDTEFVVTDLKTYIKVIYNVDNKKEIMIKTVVRGRIVGFDGDYELELPHYKGSKLKVGNKFNVKVQVGDYKGVKVIGEIKY